MKRLTFVIAVIVSFAVGHWVGWRDGALHMQEKASVLIESQLFRLERPCAGMPEGVWNSNPRDCIEFRNDPQVRHDAEIVRRLQP